MQITVASIMPTGTERSGTLGTYCARAVVLFVTVILERAGRHSDAIGRPRGILIAVVPFHGGELAPLIRARETTGHVAPKVNTFVNGPDVGGGFSEGVGVVHRDLVAGDH